MVRNDDGWRLLYDLSRDPGERRDVAARHPKVAQKMWHRLLGEVGRPPPRYSLEWTQQPSRALAGRPTPPSGAGRAPSRPPRTGSARGAAA